MKAFFLVVAVALFTSISAQQRLSAKGTVQAPDGKPVAGATVQILNTDKGVETGADGGFTLPNLTPGTYMLQVSSIGFATVLTDVAVSSGMPPFTVVLYPQARRLDEVLVSAEKREDALQRLPLSVTALNAAQVQQYRLWNTRELTAISPNLYAADPGDKRNVTSLRGIATTSYDQAVATYVDGVNQFGLDTYISTLLDVDRVEILRGPQGTLYGRNATAGVINIITRKPTNIVSGFTEATAGNYGLQRYTAALRVPIVKDRLFVGASGLYEGLGGYYTNEATGARYDKQHSVMGNYYIRFLPAAAWTITANAKHVANRNNGAFPLVADLQQAFAQPYTVNQNATTTLVDNVFNGSLSVSHAGAAFNLVSQTAYQSNYRYYTRPIDADFSPLDAISIRNNYGKDWNRVNVFTQELRLSSPANSGRAQWTAGSYFFHQHNPVKQATVFGEDAQLLGLQDKNFSLINSTTGTNKGIAFFGQVTLPLFAKTDLTVGARYDHEKTRQAILGEYQHDPDPAPVFAYRPDTSAAASFGAFSPKLAVAFHPSGSQTVYAQYSQGFRSGGLTPLSSDPAQPALYPFKPEYSHNVEAGVKNAFLQNRLRLNVTGFYTAVTDAQVPTLVLPDAVTITKNTGRLHSRGAELELAALPFAGLQLDYHFGYTHATYRELKVSQNGAEVDLQGKRAVFTPDLTSMLAAQYTAPLTRQKTWQLAARGEWRYLGRQYFDLANTLAQGAYSLFNARVGVDGQRLSFFVWGQNVSGKRYISYAYDFGAVHLGAPKTYGATARFRF